MDVEPLLAPFEACYQRFEVVKPRLAPRIRCAALLKLKRFRSVREGYFYLKNHPEAWKQLGFEELPTYELLREFLNEKLPEVLGKLNDGVLVEASKKANKLGKQIFEDVSEDAVDLKARKQIGKQNGVDIIRNMAIRQIWLLIFKQEWLRPPYFSE
jgi:hypothetical protein